MEHKSAVIGEIEVFDAGGYPVEPPFVLDLETTYIFQIPITNMTRTQGGQPWEALLETGLGVSVGRYELIPFEIVTTKFAPNLTVKYVPEISILSKHAGMAGMVRVEVFDPFGGLLARRVFLFRVGDEISPYIKFRISGKVLTASGTKGIDLPSLNYDLDNPEGVVMGTEAAVRQPPPPKPPPKKIDYSKATPPPGIDYSSKPEPPVEFEGETVIGGRLG